MTRWTLLAVFALTTLAFALGAFLGGGSSPAQAQDKPAETPAAKPVDVQAMIQPPAVVAAVPLQSRTDYEQDPFEPARLRRTQTTVLRMVLIHADGTMEIKDAP